MARFLRPMINAGGILAALFAAHHASAELPVTFQAPHAVRAPAATLDADFATAIDERLAATKIDALDELLQASLVITGNDLHFGLEHVTTLRFGAKDREGNCVEYAHLFATVFNRGAKQKHVAAHAYVVRSDARVLGTKLTARGMGDHDWVLVVPNAPDAKRLFVDPTFYDFGLGWDIAKSVAGAITTPR